MDSSFLENLLLEEHSKKQTTLIVNYVGTDKNKFKSLVNLFLKSNNPKIRQRAAWPLSYAIETQPDFIHPYWSVFVVLLDQSGLHPAIPRNILRSFQFVDIPEKFQGKIMNYCFRILSDPKELPAFKAYSITILEKMAGLYPDILPELLLILKDQFENESPAFKSRARHILKKYNK